MKKIFEKAAKLFAHQKNLHAQPNPADIFIGQVSDAVQQQMNRLDDLLTNTYHLERGKSISNIDNGISATWDGPGFGRVLSLSILKKSHDTNLQIAILGVDDRNSRPCLEFHRVWLVKTTDLSGLLDYLEEKKSSLGLFNKREPIWEALAHDVLGARGVKTERGDNFPKLSSGISPPPAPSQ